MKSHKVKAGLALVSLSAVAFATAWYCPFQVPGGYTLDKETEFATAIGVFKMNQLPMQVTGSMKQNDTVTMQYQDGTVLVFTLGAPTMCTAKTCVWDSTQPFDPNKPPVVRQGATPKGGRSPSTLNLSPGTVMPIMAVYPTITTTVYHPSVTVTQGTPSGSAVSVSYPDGTDGAYGGGGGGGIYTGGGGGGGGGGGDWCISDCPPVDER